MRGEKVRKDRNWWLMKGLCANEEKENKKVKEQKRKTEGRERYCKKKRRKERSGKRERRGIKVKEK